MSGAGSKKQACWPTCKNGSRPDARFKAPLFVHFKATHVKDKRFNASRQSVAERKSLMQAAERAANGI